VGQEARSKRLALAIVVAGVSLSGVAVNRLWTRELSHLTGRAEWIWVTDALSEASPAAALFVAPLDLDAPPPSAILKVCGDREYVVYVNGSAAACGWSRPGFRLDLFDVAHLLRQGRNVIAVEVRSPSPVGGLLLSLDVEGVGSDLLVSGPAFRSRARFALGPTDASDAPPPVDWGAPPRFPWAYPKPVSHPRTLDEVVLEDPVRVEAGAARSLEGEARLFDLPRPVYGYLWVEFAGEGPAAVATTPGAGAADVEALRSEAQPVVRLPGERRWLDPQPRQIGHVLIVGKAAPRAIEVWPVAEEFSSAAPGAVTGSFGPVPRTRWTIRSPRG